MAATRPSINPDELRARFKTARRVPQILEVQDQVRTAMRQVSDAMDEDGDDRGDGDGGLKALWEQLSHLVTEIGDRLTRQARIDELERRAAGTPLTGDRAERDFTARCAEFSLFRAAAHAIGLHGVDASREVEIQQELVRRAGGRAFTGNVVMPIEALSVQVRHLSRAQIARYEVRDVIGETRQIGVNEPPGTTGGALVGTYTDPNQYIDVLRPAMRVRQAGARVLSGLRENLRIPRMTMSGTPGFFAENSPIPTAGETFDDLTLTPHHDGAIVEVTRNMLQQSNPEIEAIVRNDLAIRLANDVDAGALAGQGGTTAQPLGIMYDALVPRLPDAAMGYDLTVDLIASLANNNALMGSLAYIGDTKVQASGLKVKDLYGRPLGDELMYHGYPDLWSNLASVAFTGPPPATDPLFFGNWADLIIGFWSELDLLVNPFETTAYSKGNVQIRAAMTLDLTRRHPESFAWVNITGAGTMIAAPAIDGMTSPGPPPTTAAQGAHSAAANGAPRRR